MANTKVTGDLIALSTITAANLADGAISASKLSNITISDLTGVSSASPVDGQVLTYDATNGWQPEDSQGGAEYTISEISTNTTAQKEFIYILTASLTVTLPASPTIGDKLAIVNTSGTTTPVVARNGSLIMGAAEDFIIDVNNVAIELIYTGETKGWVIIADSIYGADGLTAADGIIYDNGTYVGIGTETPTAKLHLYEDQDTPSSLKIQNTNNGVFATTELNLVSSGNDFTIKNYSDGDTTNANRTDLGTTVNGGYLTFSTSGGNERIRITPAGSVGIGTETPSSRLEVFTTANLNTTFKTSNVAVYNKYESSSGVLGYIGTANAIITGGGVTDFGFRSENAFVFANGLTEAMRIPATGGIAFNGDTAAANALDDYEEGTFTPTAVGLTTAGTTTYQFQHGYYTKIGRQVNVTIAIEYSALTGTGALVIQGIPFVIADLTRNNPIGSVFTDSLNWTAGSAVVAFGTLNSQNILLYGIADNAGGQAQLCVNESAGIRITMTYFTA